jgi:hypothetical protein
MCFNNVQCVTAAKYCVFSTSLILLSIFSQVNRRERQQTTSEVKNKKNTKLQLQGTTDTEI